MNPLGFAVIGAGRFGRNYVRVLQGVKGAELRAATAQTKESLDGLRKSMPSAVDVTDDYEGVLESDGIDCAIIATPASTHFAVAKKAIESGKHVLLEKPMGASLSEAYGIRETLRRSPVTFMVGHQYVYNDYVNALRRRVAAGKFGRVGHYFGEHLYNGAKNDVGCLYEAGTHQLSVIQHVLSPGELVDAKSGSGWFGGGSDDFVWAALRFSGGLRATFAVSWAVPEKTRRFIVSGEKKSAVFDDMAEKGKLRIYDAAAKLLEHGAAAGHTQQKPSVPRVRHREPILNEVERFIECVHEGAEPETGSEKSVQLMEWMEKIAGAMNK